MLQLTASLRRKIVCLFSLLCLLVFPALESGALAEGTELTEELVKELPLESGGSVSVKNDIGRIEVSVWDKNQVRIQAVKKVRKFSNAQQARELLDDLKIQIDNTSGKIKVRTLFPKQSKKDKDVFDDDWLEMLSGLFHFPPRVSSENLPLEVCFEIKLPRRASVDLSTEIGDVMVNGQGLEGNVQATSEVGSIRILRVTGDARARSEIGEISIEGVRGSVRAQTELGKIHINVLEGPVTAETELGSITVGLPRNVSADLEISTELGSIDLDFPVTVEEKISKGHIKGKIGAGGSPIVAKTQLGKVRITPIEASFAENDDQETYIENTGKKQETEPIAAAEKKETLRDVWRNRFTFGAMLSQKRDKFSKWDPLLSFEGNALWRKTDKSRMHTFFKLGLTRVPQAIEAALSQGVAEKFVASRKTLKTDLGWYWMRELRPNARDVISLGPIVDFGLESYSSQNEIVGDRYRLRLGSLNNFYYCGGLRFAHHRESWFEGNPKVLRSVDILFTRYSRFLLKGAVGESVLEASARSRMIVNANTRWFANLYLGFLANFPLDSEVQDMEGDPNLRMWLAFVW